MHIMQMCDSRTSIAVLQYVKTCTIYMHPYTAVLDLILQPQLNTGIEELLSFSSALLLLLIRILLAFPLLVQVISVGENEVCSCLCLCMYNHLKFCIQR